jgi:hypothetical protein
MPLLLVAVFTSISCSNKPAPPKPGTPAFYWGAAGSTYRAGDLVKTSENLAQLVSGENEFTGRARPWSIIVLAGLTNGYTELADIYDAGARANRANPTPFRKQASALRSLASASALQLAENVHSFMEKNQDANVTLAFAMPTGSPTSPPALKRVGTGILVQDSERDSLLQAMQQRGVLLAACNAVGSPNDTAKTLDVLKTGEAQIPRPVFLKAAAKALLDESDLFASDKLDQPNRIKLLLGEAQEALKAVPPDKDTKDLDTKIQAVLKKIK